MTGRRWLERLTTEQLAEMRSWLLDCGWCDLDWTLSDAEVVRIVAREYVGGIPQFLADSVPVDVCEVEDELPAEWEG